MIGHTQGANNSTFTHFLNPRIAQNADTAPGSLSSEASVCELLDICVLFYYSAGHKYIVKIAGVRDEIATLNEVLRETKYYREDIERKLMALEQHANVCMNDNHHHIMSELRSKFSQRQNVFAVSDHLRLSFNSLTYYFMVPSTDTFHIAGKETSLAACCSTEQPTALVVDMANGAHRAHINGEQGLQFSQKL